VAFSLGIVIFGFFLLVFIYNIAQKGISQIPGLGFLRHINRSGTVGILGFGGLFTISRLVNIDHTDIIGTLRWVCVYFLSFPCTCSCVFDRR